MTRLQPRRIEKVSAGMQLQPNLFFGEGWIQTGSNLNSNVLQLYRRTETPIKSAKMGTACVMTLNPKPPEP